MNRKSSEINNDGVSPVIATLLLVTLTVILCGIIAAVSMPFINQLEEPFLPPELLAIASGDNLVPPEILAIEFVNHHNNGGTKTFASNITLRNIGRQSLWNSDYEPEFYINGTKIRVDLFTLNASDFRAAGGSPTGIWRLYGLSGEGPSGYEWKPGAIGYIDLTDRTIRHDYVLQVDIIRKTDGKIISRSVKYIE